MKTVQQKLVLSRTAGTASLEKLVADCDFSISVLRDNLRKVQGMRREGLRALKIMKSHPKARKFAFVPKKKR